MAYWGGHRYMLSKLRVDDAHPGSVDVASTDATGVDVASTVAC